MSPEAQRIAIAETCGFRDFKTAEKIGRLITKTTVATNDAEIEAGNRREKRGLPNWPYVEIPDYLNDLNAMHQAEKVLTIPQGAVYWLTLCRDVVPLSGNAWHATAAQRAEAFLRTIGKWEPIGPASPMPATTSAAAA